MVVNLTVNIWNVLYCLGYIKSDIQVLSFVYELGFGLSRGERKQAMYNDKMI